MRLLGILETILGLGGPQINRAVRIGEYLSTLQNTDDGSLFFSRSLEVDPWSTAKELLDVRDQLVAGGWKFDHVFDHYKIDALRVVESCGDISLGEAERHFLVNRAIARCKVSPISKLTLCTDLLLLPSAWRTTVELLVARGARIESIEYCPKAASPGDLASLQQGYVSYLARANLTGDSMLVQ